MTSVQQNYSFCVPPGAQFKVTIKSSTPLQDNDAYDYDMKITTYENKTTPGRGTCPPIDDGCN